MKKSAACCPSSFITSFSPLHSCIHNLNGSVRHVRHNFILRILILFLQKHKYVIVLHLDLIVNGDHKWVTHATIRRTSSYAGNLPSNTTIRYEVAYTSSPCFYICQYTGNIWRLPCCRLHFYLNAFEVFNISYYYFGASLSVNCINCKLLIFLHYV